EIAHQTYRWKTVAPAETVKLQALDRLGRRYRLPSICLVRDLARIQNHAIMHAVLPIRQAVLAIRAQAERLCLPNLLLIKLRKSDRRLRDTWTFGNVFQIESHDEVGV